MTEFDPYLIIAILGYLVTRLEMTKKEFCRFRDTYYKAHPAEKQ